MIILQHLAYSHPNKTLQFDNLNLTINTRQKVALVGNNGVGKSTLLQLIAGNLPPSAGRVATLSPPYYLPQLSGQFNDLTIAEALKINEKLAALGAILKGSVTEANLALLADDWRIEDRWKEAMTYWGMKGLDDTKQLGSLSGGQKTRVFLSGILIHQPDIVLLDEPSNYLDGAGRKLLYNWIAHFSGTLVIVSHDRELLNLLDSTIELSIKGITQYGGNYDFYANQKLLESNAFQRDLKGGEKDLKRAKELERKAVERKLKLDSRGKKIKEKSGLPTISMNTFRNNAEKSTSRLKEAHADKIQSISDHLNALRRELPSGDTMKFNFDPSSLHKGKILFSASGLNHRYGSNFLWKEALHFTLLSGERTCLKGVNGSGKTTLIKIILGEVEPSEGKIYLANHQSLYVDQDYTLIDTQLTLYEQVQQFNTDKLGEHEVKSRLARFLFSKEYWDKPCLTLSGGEKMRLMLCCIAMSAHGPDMILLDEPTNNLDVPNVDIVINAINSYKGTLLVVSHDEYFLRKIAIKREIELG